MRLTNKIKKEIKENIESMFKNRFENIELPDSFWFDLVKDARQKIEKQMAPSSIPKEWIIKMKYASFTLGIDRLKNLKHETIKNTSVTSEQLKWIAIPVPFELIALTIYSYSNTFRINKELWSKEFIDEYVKHRQKHHDILQERLAMLENTDTICSHCNTLKQLIKTWPEVNALLPDWVTHQMTEEKYKKATPVRKPQLNQEALDSLNVSLLKNIMLTN